MPIDCAALHDARRTMLGTEQEAWLAGQLARSQARWNVLAQQTLMAPVPPRNRRVWPNGWDGYPAARERLIGQLANPAVANPVVIGGDVHGWWVADLTDDLREPGARTVATEFCGTSITSASGIPQVRADGAVLALPHLRWARTEQRGYTLVDVSPETMRVRMRAMDDVWQPHPQARTLAAFAVESGRPGAQRD